MSTVFCRLTVLHNRKCANRNRPINDNMSKDTGYQIYIYDRYLFNAFYWF